MYIRLVRGQAQPGQVEELAQRWNGFWGSRMPTIPGFRHAHFGPGQEANTILSISVWDQRPDLATMEPMMQEFQTHVRDISAAPPVVEEYETLADF